MTSSGLLPPLLHWNDSDQATTNPLLLSSLVWSRSVFTLCGTWHRWVLPFLELLSSPAFHYVVLSRLSLSFCSLLVSFIGSFFSFHVSCWCFAQLYFLLILHYPCPSSFSTLCYLIHFPGLSNHEFYKWMMSWSLSSVQTNPPTSRSKTMSLQDSCIWISHQYLKLNIQNKICLSKYVLSIVNPIFQ